MNLKDLRVLNQISGTLLLVFFLFLVSRKKVQKVQKVHRRSTQTYAEILDPTARRRWLPFVATFSESLTKRTLRGSVFAAFLTPLLVGPV